MQNSTDNKELRRRDAIRGTLLSIGRCLLVAVVMLVVRWRYSGSEIWKVLLLLVAGVELIRIIPIGIALKTRLKEIEGGEEDAAAQY